MSRTSALLSGALILILAHRPAYSQTTFASITGAVVDASGALIPKAKIVATNVETNVKTAAESNQAGDYTIAQLKEGTYEVRAEASGFKEFVARDMVLVARDERRLDIRLELGAVGARIEVTAGATLIETESGRISDTKNANTIKEIPLNSRNMYTFLALTPGLVAGTGGEAIILGSGDNQTHWSIDGTTFDDGIQSSLGPIGNHLEWIQEIRVDVSSNTAEFGPLGQVTVISKSGSNQLHGSGFDYYSTPWFRARNPFALARTSGITHLFGYSVGGPVFIPKVYNGKNKTFFFTSLERSAGSLTTQLVNPTVPLPAWRNGDFSGTPGTAIYDPEGNAPFAGNQIPASRINPVSQQIQTLYYPLPNFGSSTVLQSQNFRANLSRPFDPSTNFTIRGDQRFSDKDSIFGRWTFERSYNRPFEDNLPTIGQQIQQRNDRAGTLSYTHIFRPTLLNEARWGYALNNNPVIAPVNGPAITQKLGLVGLAPNLPDISGLLAVNWSGVGLQAINEPSYNVPGSRDHLEDFQEHISWFHGRHNVKAGFDLVRVEFDNLAADASLFGNVTFSNRFSSGGFANQGNPYADFLLGIPTTASRAFPPLGQYANHWMYDFFALDDFKINSKLTLNIGVRYELHPPWHENHDLLSLFDVALGKIVVPDGGMSKVSPQLPAGYVGVVSASTAGLPQSLVRADTNNFAPRVGLAYRPWGAHTVFRSGFGIYYDIDPREPAAGSTVPFTINEPAFTNPSTNPTVIFPRVFPATSTGGPSTVSLPASINPNLIFPYTMEYNFTIEHQRWNTGFRASYAGSGTRQGEWVDNINSPLPSTVPFVNKGRPYPNYPAILYRSNGANSDYNGLILAAQRPMAKGLYFQASFTWARDIYQSLRTDNGGIEDPFNRQREKAVAPLIPTTRFTANWLYQLPFGKGRHWLAGSSRVANLFVGGWNLSSVFSTFSGGFLTPMWTGPDPTNTAFTTSSTPAIVSIRPDQLGNPNLPSGQRSVNGWFNTAAFGPPQPGQFGTAAKDVIIGPGVTVLDAGIYKEIRFRDVGPVLRWEFTATNALNHPNWSNPVSTDITQKGNVGVISAVGGVNGASIGDQPGTRALRMGLRVEW